MTCGRLIHGLGAHAFKGVISSQGIPKAPCGALDKRSCCERERAHMQTAKKKLEVASLTDCHSSNRSSLGWKISGPHRHAFCSPFPAVGSHDRPVFPLTTPVVVLMNALFKLFPKQSPTRSESQ